MTKHQQPCYVVTVEVSLQNDWYPFKNQLKYTHQLIVLKFQ